jgi:hypothetical protein
MAYVHGEFKLSNPDKYIGTHPIYFRSSWEFKLMQMFDTHPNILNWASESLKIPYMNPFTNKYSVYVPDFLIVYNDRDGKKKSEIIEVKPLKETMLSEAKTKKDKAAVALNSFKWQAANNWAEQHGLTFRVMTEHDIFNNPVKRK